MGLYSEVTWQVAGPKEEAEIRRWFGVKSEIVTAPDLPFLASANVHHGKTIGSARLVFLSRISKMKNLAGGLAMLAGVAGDIQLDIYGPIEDPSYWEHCNNVIRTLPANIKVRYCGPVSHDGATSVLAEYDAFFLPSLGEGFGHAIVEALGSGCPVLISDRTPWRHLKEKGVGWDLPLEDSGTFRRALQELVDMGPREYLGMSERARKAALDFVKDSEVIERNRKLFGFPE
jgi:glycosyltransferase involved in cell wall biosynthesis